MSWPKRFLKAVALTVGLFVLLVFAGAWLIDSRDCAAPNVCEEDLGAGLLGVAWVMVAGLVSVAVGVAYGVVGGVLKARRERR